MAVRKRVRLKTHDYRWSGFYFFTVCIHQRICLLGEVTEGVFTPNTLGEIAQACWLELPEHSPRAHLDAFYVMPNHVHGIIEIRAPYIPFEPRAFGKPRKHDLATMIGGYKSAVSRKVNRIHNVEGESLWQPGYHEHVIRTEGALENIRAYIQTNPLKWAEDQLHPDNPSDWFR